MTLSIFEKFMNAGIVAGMLGTGAGLACNNEFLQDWGVTTTGLFVAGKVGYYVGRKDANDSWEAVTSRYLETHDELERVRGQTK